MRLCVCVMIHVYVCTCICLRMHVHVLARERVGVPAGPCPCVGVGFCVCTPGLCVRDGIGERADPRDHMRLPRVLEEFDAAPDRGARRGVLCRWRARGGLAFRKIQFKPQAV